MDAGQRCHATGREDPEEAVGRDTSASRSQKPQETAPCSLLPPRWSQPRATASEPEPPGQPTLPSPHLSSRSGRCLGSSFRGTQGELQGPVRAGACGRTTGGIQQG